ncbi:MAG: glucose 1-dehydrogenase [Myxococcota bacterium]|nr:glucose 1-dehydrogenase [Myxococcota bacterium]
MAGRLDGKVAWINGASRGIGLAIADAFVAEGAVCAISSRKHDAILKVAETLSESHQRPVRAYSCHTGRQSDVETTYARMREAIGTPDILVNNAGTSPYFGPLLDAPDVLWDKTFDVNLKGPFWATRCVAKSLLDAGKGGSIINIASIQGHLGSPLQGVYGLTKSALVSMTKTLALELGQADIRVNAICPGLVATKLASLLTDNPEFSKSYTDRAALGRFGQPDEIAGTAVFLASDESAYLTGQSIIIDGGYTAA